MPVPTVLSLTGYRATGKSAVGTQLAKLVGYKCVDTDEVVKEMAGKSIAAIFSEDGEAVFRDLESDAIASTLLRTGVILALGGGAVLRAQNRTALRRAGPVVWLKASVATIRRRLESDLATAAQRPGLSEANPVDEVASVLAQRLPIYAGVADLEVDTEDHEPAAIAAIIASAFFAE